MQVSSLLNILHLTVYWLIYLENLNIYRRKLCNVLWFWTNINNRNFGWAVEGGRKKFRTNQDVFINKLYFIILTPFKPKQDCIIFPLTLSLFRSSFLAEPFTMILFFTFLKLSWLVKEYSNSQTVFPIQELKSHTLAWYLTLHFRTLQLSSSCLGLHYHCYFLTFTMLHS